MPLASATFSATPDDHVDVMSRALPRSPMAQRAVRAQQKNAYLAIAGAALAMALFGYFQPGGGPTQALRMVLILAPIGAMYLLFAARRSAILRRFRRRLEQGIRSGQIPEVVNGPWTIDLEPEALVTKNEHATVRFSWARCRAVLDEPDAVWLDFSESGYVRVPDRAFGDTERRSWFVATAKDLYQRAGMLEGVSRQDAVEGDGPEPDPGPSGVPPAP